MHYSEFLFLALFALHINWKRCSQEGSRTCYSQSQVVYAYHVLSLSLHGFFCTIFGLFGGAWHEIEVSVVTYMYFKHSPDYIDSKYIWFHGSNSQGSSIFTEVPFLAFLALYRKRRRCGQVGPNPCYSQSEVVYTYWVLNL